MVTPTNSGNSSRNKTTFISSCRGVKGCLSWVFSKKRGSCFVFLFMITFFISRVERNQPTTMYEDLDKELSESRLRHKTKQQRNKIHRWRNSTKSKCQKASKKIKTKWDKSAQKQRQKIEIDSMKRIDAPDPSTVSDVLLPNSRQIYDKTCQNTFIDLGTNIGDTIGYFIDSGMDVCTPIWKENNPGIEYWATEYPRPRINVETLQLETIGEHMNNAMHWLFWHMQEWDMKPEETCVYGMEGNPYFTKRLQKLENFLWQMNPRFFQHLHIHTEHVITRNDGPTLLYLDEVSTAQNFWGSSILDSLTDAKQTAELHGGQPVAANVTGVSLSTLLRRTMAAFNDDAPKKLKSNGRLVIKMDIEGAEYQVLEEARDSHILCDFIAKGNQVVLLVEFHDGNQIEDAAEYAKQSAGIEKTKSDLVECGVQFETMYGNWA